MRRFFYLIKEALVSLRVNRTSVLIGIVTTAFTLACFGLFALLYWNLKNLSRTLQSDIEFVVYLEPDISKKVSQGIQQRFKHEPAIDSFVFISKDQALKEFYVQFPNESALLEGLGENPLPASYVIRIASRFQDAKSIEKFAERVKDLPGIERVKYSQDWIDSLSLFVTYFELAAIIIGTILAIATITIVANTVRLSFYARREEVEILRLIGATGAFIVTPYVIEGAILGALGGVVSIILLKGTFEFFRMEMGASGWFSGLESMLTFFPIQGSFILVLAGVLLGCGSSFLSVYGLMKVRNE